MKGLITAVKTWWKQALCRHKNSVVVDYVFWGGEAKVHCEECGKRFRIPLN